MYVYVCMDVCTYNETDTMPTHCMHRAIGTCTYSSLGRLFRLAWLSIYRVGTQCVPRHTMSWVEWESRHTMRDNQTTRKRDNVLLYRVPTHISLDPASGLP